MSKAVVLRREADHAVTHQNMLSQLADPGSEDGKQRVKPHSTPALTPDYTTLDLTPSEVLVKKEKIDRQLPYG